MVNFQPEQVASFTRIYNFFFFERGLKLRFGITAFHHELDEVLGDAKEYEEG